MGLELTRQTWTVHDRASTGERNAAARYVASIATSKDDAAQLLAALGLLPAHHPAVMRPGDHGIRGYQLGCKCKRCRKANRCRLQRQRATQTTTTADVPINTTTGSSHDTAS